jgi:hypothetical protein
MNTLVPNLLDNAAAAKALGITPKTLRLWRHLGKGPRYIKFTGDEQRARCAYDLADIEAWLDARKFTSTSAATVAAAAAERAAVPRTPSAPVVAPWLQSAV